MKFVYEVIAQSPSSIKEIGRVRYLILEDTNWEVRYSKDDLKTTLQNINQYPLFDGLWTNNAKDYYCSDYYPPDYGADIWIKDKNLIKEMLK